MKKIYSILALLCVITLTASAKNPFVKNKKAQKNQQIEIRNAALRNLYPAGVILPDSALLYNGNQTTPSTKLTYSKDNEGRIIETSSNRDETENKWYYSSQVTFKFDSENRSVEEAYSWWNTDEQQWKKSYMDKTSYHKGDKPLTFEYYSNYDTAEGEWDLREKASYQYDEKDNIISYETYDNIDGLVLSEKAKAEYTVDEDGYLNYLIYFKDIQAGESEYKIGLKSKMKYNDQHYLVYRERAEWYDEQWYEPSKTVIVYENGRLISSKGYDQETENDPWLFRDGTTYTYDEKGQLVKTEEYSHDSEGEAYQTINYYYPASSGIETGKTGSDVKLSIANGVLSVNSKDSEMISVYTVTGTKINSFGKNRGEVSVNINAQQGLVIVKGTSGWARKAICK